MGADLAIAVCPVPSMDDGSQVEWERICVEADARCCTAYDNDPEYWKELLGGEDDVERQEVIDMMLAFVQDSLDAYLQGYRDIAVLVFDRPYLITGGMTWGDEPTESFRSIQITEETGVFDNPFSSSFGTQILISSKEH